LRSSRRVQPYLAPLHNEQDDLFHHHVEAEHYGCESDCGDDRDRAEGDHLVTGRPRDPSKFLPHLVEVAPDALPQRLAFAGLLTRDSARRPAGTLFLILLSPLLTLHEAAHLSVHV